MNKDIIRIIDNNQEKEIYPLIEINQKGRVFIYYLKELKENFTKDEVYIGEINSNNEIQPVDNEVLKEANSFLENLLSKLV